MRTSLVLFSALAACDGGSRALAPGTSADDPARVTQSCGGLPSDGFQLQAAMTIDADRILKVSVSYGGGCEEHTFAACWNGGIAKTNPATLTLELHHDANNDLCDAFVTRDLFIDLAGTPANFGAPARVGETSIRLTEEIARGR